MKLQSVSKNFVLLREARFNRTATAAVSESAIGKLNIFGVPDILLERLSALPAPERSQSPRLKHDTR